MKKYSIISLMLVVLMISISIVSCGDKGTNEETTRDVVTVGDDSENIELDPRDFGAKEFRILDANDHPDMHVNYSETMSGSNIEKALCEKDYYLESRNNIDIVYTQVNNCNLNGIDSFTISFSAGDRLYDMVVSTASGTRLATIATNGYFTDLAKLPTLDLSEKWWSSQMYEQMSLGGKMYFTTGDIMASVYDSPMAVYANKALLSKYQINDNLYQKVRDGEWTVEYMSTLVKDLSEDLNQDGVMHANDDFFGVACQPVKMTSTGLLVGMGFDMSYVVGNSIVVNDDMETLSSLTQSIKKVITTAEMDRNVDIIDKTFKQDRAVFLIHLMEAANHNLKDMASDYCVLPMPKLSEEQDNYRSYINGWVDCFIAVPEFSEDNEYREMVGYMLEAMARASYSIVRPVAFDQVVMYQSIREESSIEMLNIIYNTLYLDFNGIYDFGKMCTYISNHIFYDESLVSTITAAKGTITSEAGKIATAWMSAETENQ